MRVGEMKIASKIASRLVESGTNGLIYLIRNFALIGLGNPNIHCLDTLHDLSSFPMFAVCSLD